MLESDRGGFAVHLLCVERGRVHRETIWIDVPWTNKQLQVEWMSFRDKLQPGDKEEWRLKLKGPKGEQVTAQLLAGMYDASLDHFVPHDWSMSIWGRNDARFGWSRGALRCVIWPGPELRARIELAAERARPFLRPRRAEVSSIAGQPVREVA